MPQLLNMNYFDTWKSMLNVDIQKAFFDVENIVLEPNSFTFYTSISVMASSKIEGEQMELDSYVKHKLLDIEYIPELLEKPNDLYQAYLFAKEIGLTKETFLKAHQLISAHLLPKNQQGELRKNEMLILDHKTGRIEYEAAAAIQVLELFDKLWIEINELVQKNLSIEEIFYFASFIHCVFAKIHPFNDGNGRAVRLLEKWFLVEKLGERAWYIKSEKHYYVNVNNYYKNLARIGMFYDELNYDKSIPFLLMLPNALIFEK